MNHGLAERHLKAKTKIAASNLVLLSSERQVGDKKMNSALSYKSFKLSTAYSCQESIYKSRVRENIIRHRYSEFPRKEFEATLGM